MIVFDSSTLILLARTEMIELFIAHFEKSILIPYGVETEVFRKGDKDTYLIEQLMNRKKIQVVEIKHTHQVIKLMKDFNIGSGEAEAIILALRKGIKLIATDDRNAIRACKLLHLEFVTAITVLVRLFETGLLEKTEAYIKLQKLQYIGRYSKTIINDAMKHIGGGV